jgi:hypothetical protein
MATKKATTAKGARPLDATATGAAALVGLIRAIDADTSRSFARRAAVVDTRQDERENSSDPRDYIALVRRVDRTLQRSYCKADSKHREGFLRALADLLSIVADGAVPAIEDWDPIAATDGSYRAREASADRRFQRALAGWLQ